MANGPRHPFNDQPSPKLVSGPDRTFVAEERNRGRFWNHSSLRAVNGSMTTSGSHLLDRCRETFAVGKTALERKIMSGTPWMYFCPYQENIVRALEELKTREFAAGRYYPAMLDHWLHLPIPPDLPSPGAQHDSIQAALNASGQGTQSVLDIQSLSNEPAFLAVSPMEEEELDLYFGTTRPTHTIVANCTNFLEEIEPGQGRYIIVYADGEPSEIVFAGYSFG